MNSPLQNPGSLPVHSTSSNGIAPQGETVFEFPATFAQRRFWLLHQWSAGGNAALNMTLSLRIRGPLNCEALGRSLNKIVGRHEALRTNFAVERGELRQLISPTLPIDLRRIPRQREESLTKENCARVVENSVREEARRPFDVHNGPLIRASLVQLNDLEHLLLITTHRLVADEWSSDVIVPELGACYAAFAQDRQPVLPELQLQFADYAQWQHERLTAGHFAEQRAYWKEQLTGNSLALSLSAGQSSVASKERFSARFVRVLSPPDVDAVTLLAIRHGTAPQVVFLALFDVLLHRYTGQRSFFVTVPSPNREREGFGSLVGPLANPLLLRADLSNRPSFLEVIRRVGQVTLDAFANQEVPFELLLDDFHASELPVSFTYRSLPAGPVTRAGGSTIELLGSVNGGTLCALSAAVIEQRTETRLELEYDAARFDQATVERMLSDYETLLREFANHPAQSISPAPWLTLPTGLSREDSDTVRKPVATVKKVAPYLGLQLQLIGIWEDVLGVQGIGIRENFFDLGGNSLLALRMLLRAERICGRAVFPSSFGSNPTIESLASEIAREAVAESPSLIAVHEGGSRPPFFYLHGDLFGGGFYSLKLSSALGLDQPLYVLPPHNLGGLSKVPTVEQMAAAHLKALRTARPHGPYIVGGFCLGGIVAYELAQQLMASGEKVEMLVLIDAKPRDKSSRVLRHICEISANLFRWDNVSRVDRFEQWTLLRTQFALWSQLNLRRKIQSFLYQIRKRLVGLTSSRRRAAEGSSGRAKQLREFDVPAAFLWAAAGYSPKPYPGLVALLLSEDLLERGRHLARSWQRIAPEATVHLLKGSHLECITAHVDSLAATIDDCLRDLGNA